MTRTIQSQTSNDAPKNIIPNSVQYDKLPSGYEEGNIPKNYNLIPCRISDADSVLLNLFNRKLQLRIFDNIDTPKEVPAKFSGGERFSFIQKRLGLNPTTTLQPPLIALKRLGYDISMTQGIGRTLGQDTGDITICTRLSDQDPRYQALINKSNIQHQDNIAHPLNAANPLTIRGSKENKVSSRRYSKKYHRSSGLARDFLNPELGDNIYEIIKIPFPKYLTAKYEITFWTSHIKHMHQLLEQFTSSFDNQQNQFVATSNSGHSMVIYIEDDINFQDNFEDYSDAERDIKITINAKILTQIYGLPNALGKPPIRSFISAPSFEYETILESGKLGEISYNTIYDKNGNAIYVVNDLSLTKEDKIFGQNIGDKVRYVRPSYRNIKAGEYAIPLSPELEEALDL